jgi:hypothetical protein
VEARRDFIAQRPKNEIDGLACCRKQSGELEAFEFDVGGGKVGEIVVCLLSEPRFGTAAENFGEADGHFGRDAEA